MQPQRGSAREGQRDSFPAGSVEAHRFRVAQNVGYMIPVPVIQRFLKDVEDGKYDHYVDLAISDFPIENSAQKKALGVGEDGVGVMVAEVEPAGSAGGALERGDVLLSLDDNPVLNNGLIRFEGELMDMSEVVERKFAGDKLKISFLRGGKKQQGGKQKKGGGSKGGGKGFGA